MTDTTIPAAALPVPRGPGDHGGYSQGGVDMNATSARHMILVDQMIAWQIANPGKPWTECARMMGLSTLWVRTMASTDAFKARYAQISDDLIREIGLVGLKDKIKAAAEMAVERLAEKIPVMESISDLNDTTEMLLGQVYGKQGGAAPAPSPTVTINQQIIMEERARLLGQAPPEEK